MTHSEDSTPMTQNHHHPTVTAALEAYARGFTPIPVRSRSKRPHRSNWTHTRWADEQDIVDGFTDAIGKGGDNVGLVLGRGNLVDVDLDHPLAMRLRDYFIPPSDMETGRPGQPRSHRWFIVDGEIPGTRQYKMPDKSMVIELRSTGGQTVIPPSTHPTGESYQWEGEPWGGDEGPAVIPARVLSIQVALLALTAVLVENWPTKGSRHEAYLCLAGGLLRHGDRVHEYWADYVHVLIGALADITHDDDGPDTRIAETVDTTLRRIRSGQKVAGWPKLAEIIGTDHAEQARRMAKEVESLAGFTPEVIRDLPTVGHTEESLRAVESGENDVFDEEFSSDDESGREDDAAERNPLEERITSWAAVDLEPYLSGEVVVPEPSVLRRNDGAALFYPGRVNSLYGKSESAKSWIAMHACIQEMSRGERVVYLDFEDEPAGTLSRMQLLGASEEDIKHQFRYVHPEGPLASMQRTQFGGYQPSEEGLRSESVFWAMLDVFDPTLIVADGMTVLYGLHGLDTNHATATDVITTWFKSLTRGGRTTVLVIDHTGKSGGTGSAPIGAHHKIAMVQGASLRADALVRPVPGAIGHIRLAVHKDRPGAVRAVSSTDDEQIAAEVKMDSTEPDMVRMDIEPPTSAPPIQVKVSANIIQQQEDRELIVEAFAGDTTTGFKTNDLATTTGLTAQRTAKLLRDLVDGGRVIKSGVTKGTLYYLAPPRVPDGVDALTGEVLADDDDE